MSEDKTKRVYELGYIITPTTPETEVAAEVAKLKDAIEKTEGAVVAEGAPEFIDLAYTMEKNVASKKMKWSQGYFGWMKFEGAPEMQEALKKALDANLAVIRYLLVKTTLENTVIFKKPKVEAKRAGEFSEEELDELANATDEMPEDGVDIAKEDHELLPDVTDDVVETKEIEAEEKESLA